VELAELLRAQIQCGEIAVGARLPSQRAMAEKLGVGRQAVQEALSLLEAEGYLETRRGAHGGSFVCEPVAPVGVWLELLRSSIGDLEDSLDFRCGIEAQIVRLACLRRTDDDLADMQAAVDSLTNRTRAGFREADGNFHASLSRAARNERLEVALRRSRADLFVPTDNLPYVEEVEVSRRQHQSILNAVARRNEAAAVRAVISHIEETRRRLRSLVTGESA
jgi:GntR family transcriptional repressor for pyruvate dehydrogenase complex